MPHGEEGRRLAPSHTTPGLKPTIVIKSQPIYQTLAVHRAGTFGVGWEMTEPRQERAY